MGIVNKRVFGNSVGGEGGEGVVGYEVRRGYSATGLYAALAPRGAYAAVGFFGFSRSACHFISLGEEKKRRVGRGVSGWRPAWNGTYPWFVYPEQSSSVMQLKPVFFSLQLTCPQHTPYNLIFQHASGSRLNRGERKNSPSFLPTKEKFGELRCVKLTTIAIGRKGDLSITAFFDACPSNAVLGGKLV